MAEQLFLNYSGHEEFQEIVSSVLGAPSLALGNILKVGVLIAFYEAKSSIML